MLTSSSANGLDRSVLDCGLVTSSSSSSSYCLSIALSSFLQSVNPNFDAEEEFPRSTLSSSSSLSEPSPNFGDGERDFRVGEAAAALTRGFGAGVVNVAREVEGNGVSVTSIASLSGSVSFSSGSGSFFRPYVTDFAQRDAGRAVSAAGLDEVDTIDEDGIEYGLLGDEGCSSMESIERVGMSLRRTLSRVVESGTISE